MKKESKTLTLIGLILIMIGVLFGLKDKLIDKNIEVLVKDNIITYKNGQNYTINQGEKGKINIKINTNRAGIYKIEFSNLQEGLNIYSDSKYTEKIDAIYKIYDTPLVEEFVVYYKNDGKKYNGNIKLETKNSSMIETMVNKASTKEYFWSDEYRPYIENIDFIKNNNFICQDLCFDISNEVGKVYANLIKLDDKYDLQIISDMEIYLPIDSSYMFNNFENLKNVNFANINTKYTKNMSYMFANNPNLESLDLSNFNTQNIENIEGMFMNSTSLNTIDLSTFKFENINTNNLFMNINNESTIYVKSSVEQAWIFGSNNTNRPENWKAKNVLVK